MEYSPGVFPDPCLGKLRGIDFACCGHGNARHAYVAMCRPTKKGTFGGLWVLRGRRAGRVMRWLGGKPAEFREDTREISCPAEKWSGVELCLRQR